MGGGHSSDLSQRDKLSNKAVAAPSPPPGKKKKQKKKPQAKSPTPEPRMYLKELDFLASFLHKYLLYLY